MEDNASTTATKQFRVTAYHCDRDLHMKRGGHTFTDIGSLLTFLNKARYYQVSNCTERKPDEEWDYRINEAFDGLEGRVRHWIVEEKPTDTKIRIVGVNMWYALPQRTGVCVYEDLNDPRLADIPQGQMYLYPYTMEEFLNLLSNPIPRHGRCGELTFETVPWQDCDFIALLRS